MKDSTTPKAQSEAAAALRGDNGLPALVDGIRALEGLPSNPGAARILDCFWELQNLAVFAWAFRQDQGTGEVFGAPKVEGVSVVFRGRSLPLEEALAEIEAEIVELFTPHKGNGAFVKRVAEIMLAGAAGNEAKRWIAVMDAYHSGALKEARTSDLGNLLEAFEEQAERLTRRLLALGPEEVERDGMLAHTCLFYDALDALGTKGVDVYRDAAREHWKAQDTEGIWRAWAEFKGGRWVDSWYRILLQAVWAEQVLPARKRVETHRPALAVPVALTVERSAWRKDRVWQPSGKNQLSLFEGGERIAHTPPLLEAQLMNVVQDGTKELRTITGVRLIVGMVREAHRRWALGETNPTILSFPGGLQSLADAIGDTSSRATGRLQNILRAGQDWRITWPNGEAGGLWTYTYQAAEGRNARAHLQVRLGEPLAPLYIFDGVPDSHKHGVLMPVVEIAPLIGSPRDHAAQAAFQISLIRAIVERRQDIARRGGAHLTLQDLWVLAEPLGLSRKTMGKALERWAHDGDDGAAFLDVVEKDHYHLADNEVYGPARRFIDATASRSAKRSKQGKASAERRRRR